MLNLKEDGGSSGGRDSRRITERSLEEVLAELGLKEWVILECSEVTENGFPAWHVVSIMG